jgi:hypothetical protein
VNAHQKIRKAMRAVELEVKRHIRKYGPLDYMPCVSQRFVKALDRLVSKGEAEYNPSRGGYVLTKKRRAS